MTEKENRLLSKENWVILPSLLSFYYVFFLSIFFPLEILIQRCYMLIWQGLRGPEERYR